MNWPSALDDSWGWAALVLAGATSALATWLAIHYANRRGLIDAPGQRRSHALPTARGGGIGIVVIALVAFCLPWFWTDTHDARWIAWALFGGFGAVAAVGWWDDHRPLSVRLRIGVHCAAAAALGVALLLPLAAQMPFAVIFFLALIVLTSVWSINLHNFMDGINGLLACQSIFVFSVFAALSALAGMHQSALQLALVAAACLGFLPFNFPRARIFMGDVGSGALGFLVAASVWLGLLGGPIDPIIGAIACSGFVIDATATLLSRMTNGRRWYSAHREHLYQWLVRSGRSHASVVGIYMLWNVVVVVPALALYAMAALTGKPGFPEPVFEIPPQARFWLPMLVYALGTILWIAGKRACLNRVRNASRRHDHA